MDIVFCLSYLSLNQTIFLIEKNKAKNVKIITSNRSIEIFFSSIYGENIIHFVESSSLLLPSTPYKLLTFPIKLLDASIKKFKAWRYFRTVKNRKVYFFFNSSGFFHAWLIYKLSKNNKIFFLEDLNLDSFKEINSKATTRNRKFIKFFYKEEVIPLDQKTGVTYKISDAFLEKCKIKKFVADYNFDEIIKVFASKIDLPSGNILYLPPLLRESKINENIYIKTVDDIISFCNKERLNLHLKRHPRSNEIYSQEKEVFEIPIYYPANCLINYKVTIGFASATLYEIANQGGLSISLVKILLKDDMALTNNIIDYLKSNLIGGKQIIFPENTTELKKLLSYYCKYDFIK